AALGSVRGIPGMNELANEPMTAPSHSPGLDFNTPALKRKRRIRALKDRLARWYVTIGGLAVLGAITLIFFYLAQVVLPMFQGADLQAEKAVQPAWLAEQSPPLLLAVEEQNQVALRLSADGQAHFFSVVNGDLLRSEAVALPADSQIVSLGEDTPGTSRFVLGLSTGQALVIEHAYKLTYPDNQKTITPELVYPFGTEPIQLDPHGRPLQQVSVSLNGSDLLLAAATDNELHALRLEREENLFTGEVSLEERRFELPRIAEPIKAVLIDPRQQWLYSFNGQDTGDVMDPRRQHA